MYDLPFLIPLAALVTGIVTGSSLEGPAWGLIPVAAGLMYYLILLRKSAIPAKALKLNSRHAVWIFLLFAGIGMFDAWWHRPETLSPIELSRYVAAEGEVRETISRANGDRLVVDISHLSDSAGNLRGCDNLRIVLQTDGVTLDVGDIILFPARLQEVKDNPNFRPSGYADRMKRQGINYRAYTEGATVSKISHHTSLTSASAEWRDRIAATIENSALERPTVNFLVALLLGDRSLLSDDVRETFSNAGVAHVLALSGLHVAIVMGIILFLLFPMKLLGMHRLRFWIALIVLWGYAYLSGLAPSTVRACVMTSFVILAMSLQRRNASGNALLASAFAILLFDPAALFDAGMQLSFICVAGILTFAGQLNNVNRHFHPWLHSIVSAILVSLVATGCSWVLVSYYFSKIPLLFLPVNLVLLPLLPAYVGTALLYLAFLIAGIDLHPVASVLDRGYSFFTVVAERLSAFGESAISCQVQLPVVILWLLGVLLIGFAMKRGKKKVALSVGAVMLAGSLLMIPLLRNSVPDGFIIQKNSSDISLALYDHESENVARLPRNAVSRIVHKGCEIISIDCLANLDSLSNIIMSKKRMKRRYMILGSGFSPDSLSRLPALDRFDRIVVHPSVRRKIEADLMEKASAYGLEKLHSLREDGPFKVDISD